MSIEYIFLNEALRDRFIEYARGMGIESSARQDEMDAFLAAVPDDIDEGVAEAIETEYELLMEEQDGLLEKEEDWLTQDVMGIPYTLADGRQCVIHFKGDIGRRLGEHFTPEEIQSLVTAIAQCLENPVDGPLCKIT